MLASQQLNIAAGLSWSIFCVADSMAISASKKEGQILNLLTREIDTCVF